MRVIDNTSAYLQSRPIGGEGGLALIESQTASADSSLAFDIPTTHDAYTWRFYNIHPADESTTDQIYLSGRLMFQVNNTGNSLFDDSTFTTTQFYAYHAESDAWVYYSMTGDLLSEDADYQVLGSAVSTEADSSISGWLTIYGTKSGTFHKQFEAQTIQNTDNTAGGNDHVQMRYTAGYISDVKVIDEIDFKFVNDNMDTGTIAMYGVK
tara:strand:- start:4 stop:630 length:627 start_codon:yes stop_codon:yes gene_type:complete